MYQNYEVLLIHIFYILCWQNIMHAFSRSMHDEAEADYINVSVISALMCQYDMGYLPANAVCPAFFSYSQAISVKT